MVQIHETETASPITFLAPITSWHHRIVTSPGQCDLEPSASWWGSATTAKEVRGQLQVITVRVSQL